MDSFILVEYYHIDFMNIIIKILLVRCYLQKKENFMLMFELNLTLILTYFIKITILLWLYQLD
jgi:hypothetical protein